jgi:hypothetical protein
MGGGIERKEGLEVAVFAKSDECWVAKTVLERVPSRGTVVSGPKIEVRGSDFALELKAEG